MISLIISLLFGTLIGFLIGFFIYPGFGIFLGIIAAIVTFFFLLRFFSKKLQEIFTIANVEIQKQNSEKAIEILKTGYKYNNWQFLVAAQINSQIGVILYTQKKFGEAYKFLQKSNPRIYMAYCMLAIGHIKNGQKEKAEQALYLVQKLNKKEPFVYSMSAYLLETELNNKEKALEAIHTGLKHMPNNQNLTEHLLSLQNNKKFKMEKYGDIWYQMMLDKNVMAKLQKKYMAAHQHRMGMSKKIR